MIDVIKVKNEVEGNLKAHEILKKIVDFSTLLALSGGTTPDYSKMIVEPADILPGAVCIVDERWIHQDSDTNLHMMKKVGLAAFLEKNKINFYGVQHNANLEDLVEGYDFLIRDLFDKFPKKVGVMGVGENLHTAGIFPKSEAVHSPDFIVWEEVKDEFPKRITLTLRALGEFQTFIILMFGKEKKEALKKLLDEHQNDMQKYPAIFYRKAKAKAYLITDQNI